MQSPFEFYELTKLERLIEKLKPWSRSFIIDEVSYNNTIYPLHVISIGSQDPEAPTIGYFGGVHGLEKIGSEVLHSYLNTLSELLPWDKELQKRLESSRLVFMPMVNPVGVHIGRRSNGKGVDLMRNAPIEGDSLKKRIYSGHRISPKLPWYRGAENTDMETESKALIRVVKDFLLPAKISLALDIHSGFGTLDRLWFPYAKSHEPFPLVAEAMAFKRYFDTCYPHHVYRIEPVSNQYVIDGDLWDYVFEEHLTKKNPDHLFIPWTLEMGSWTWLRKSPTNIIQRWGIYHPIKPHRIQRIFRRHLTLFDFLHRLILHPGPWLNSAVENKTFLEKLAQEKWYDKFKN